MADDLPTRPAEKSTYARRQVSLALGVGLVTAVVVAVFAPRDYAPLVGWDVAVLVYVGWVWVTNWSLDPERTASIAAREDPTRGAADVLLLIASVASLGAIGVVLAQAGQAQGMTKVGHVTLGVASVVCSWFLVHSIFTLKYARQYYTDEDGGIDFNQKAPPRWTDFAYLAFTIGMTFQVSDTDLQTSSLRRLALRHMMLSYLFGTVIIGVTINLIAGLNK